MRSDGTQLYSRLKQENKLHQTGTTHHVSRCSETNSQGDNNIPMTMNDENKSTPSQPIFSTSRQNFTSSTSQKKSIVLEDTSTNKGFGTSLPLNRMSKVNSSGLLGQLEQRVKCTANQMMSNNKPDNFHQISPSPDQSTYESPPYSRPTDIIGQHHLGMGSARIPQDTTSHSKVKLSNNGSGSITDSRQSVTFAKSHHLNNITPTPHKMMGSNLMTKNTLSDYSVTPLSNNEAGNVTSGPTCRNMNIHEGKNSTKNSTFKVDDFSSSINQHSQSTFNLDSYESELKKHAKATMTGALPGGISTHHRRTKEQSQHYGQGQMHSPFPGMVNGVKKGDVRFGGPSSSVEIGEYDDDRSSSSLRINHGTNKYSTPSVREKTDSS